MAAVASSVLLWPTEGAEAYLDGCGCEDEGGVVSFQTEADSPEEAAMRDYCTVCGLELEPSEAILVKEAERSYYFCSERCLEAFHENPESFVEDWENDEDRLSA